MSEIPVDSSPAPSTSTVDVEREVTKRAMIQSITNVVMVVLYMAFAFLRDREPGVVALDASSDDWS